MYNTHLLSCGSVGFTYSQAIKVLHPHSHLEGQREIVVHMKGGDDE